MPSARTGSGDWGDKDLNVYSANCWCTRSVTNWCRNRAATNTSSRSYGTTRTGRLRPSARLRPSWRTTTSLSWSFPRSPWPWKIPVRVSRPVSKTTASPSSALTNAIFVSDEDLEPGSQRQYSLNDFELIRVIGRGSYAKVLMVELKKTRRIYAMKVIKKALVTDDEVSSPP